MLWLRNFVTITEQWFSLFCFWNSIATRQNKAVVNTCIVSESKSKCVRGWSQHMAGHLSMWLQECDLGESLGTDKKRDFRKQSLLAQMAFNWFFWLVLHMQVHLPVHWPLSPCHWGEPFKLWNECFLPVCNRKRDILEKTKSGSATRPGFFCLFS